MLRVRVNRPGIERLRNIIGALRLSDADKAGPVLTVLNRVHVAQVKRAFTSRGATVATGPWPPWSARYAAWRAKYRRLGNRMMRLTDTLFGKSTSTSHGDYVGRWIGGVRYIFGFRDDVGFFHQQGTAAGVFRHPLSDVVGKEIIGFTGLGPGVPKRSLIDKTETDVRDFAAAFVRFYRAHIRRVARGAARLGGR